MQGAFDGSFILKLYENPIFIADQDKKVFINRNEIASIVVLTDDTDKHKNQVKAKLKSGDEYILGTYNHEASASDAIMRALHRELYFGVIDDVF